MKKLFLILISILLLGTINVQAEEEYNIVIDENNNFILTDSSNNQITDNTIAKYEENTLTLGEGKYFNQIKVKSDATITSNDKGVYIKELTSKEGNDYILANITINKLKVNESDTYIFKIDLGGNLIVNDSVLISQEEYEIKGYIYFIDSKIENAESINSRSIDEDGNGIKVINSTINYHGQLYTQTGGNYIKNSNISGNSLYAIEKFYIENSNIYCGYFTKQNGNYDTIIKNSTIKVTKEYPSQAYLFSGNLTLEDTFFEAGSLYISKGELNINNSTINLSSNAYIKKSVSIKNSKLSFLGTLSLTERNELTSIKIEDSEVAASDFYIPSCTVEGSENETRFYAKNSKVTANKGNFSSLLHGNIVFENCELNIIENLIYSYNNFSLINCTGKFSGGVIIDHNLLIRNSKLLFLNENSRNEQYSSLAVKNDLKINNSNVIFDNTNNNKKPILVQGNIVLDDRIIPIDQGKELLKVKELEDSTEERTNCPSCFNNNKPIFSFAYEDESYTSYVQLATQKTATFKVKNGTWLDGTSDDIKIDYLYGEPLEIENLPKEVQELLTSKMGSWSMDLNNLDTTKDLDIEFKYDLINPETKRNLILIMIISIITFFSLRLIRREKVNNN